MLATAITLGSSFQPAMAQTEVFNANTSAAEADGLHILPSGEAVTLHEIIRDPGEGGDAGGIWRFRFIMPTLALRVPPGEGEELDGITEEDMAELDKMGLPTSFGPFSVDEFDSAELVTLEELEAEGAIDSMTIIDLDQFGLADLPGEGPALPADPNVLLQDPIHADLVWLCEQVALPSLPPEGDRFRPALIVISLADRPVEFGEFALDAVQIFEGFTPADDGNSCLWEPW